MDLNSDDNAIVDRILDAAFEVHRALGPGLLESAYEGALTYELAALGLSVERQVAIPVRYKELSFGEGFRADLFVEPRIIVDLKSVERVQPVPSGQLLT